MNNLIKEVHPETREILNNAYYARYIENSITQEDYEEIVKSCFLAEAWRGHEASQAAPSH